MATDSNSDAKNRQFEGASAPSMPRRAKKFKHLQKYDHVPFYSACVARSVTRAEARSNKDAKAALDKEWLKLRTQGAWNEQGVREWEHVRREAIKNNKKVHIGRVFDICVEKNSELPEGDPNRKFKGRVVFEGCNVRDEFNNWAIFAEISSCPATMEAGKAADAYGMFPGHAEEMADGESAYTQAKLGGETTWIRVPKDQWPEEWIKKGYVDPVCPLVLALYGHPDAGGFWEQHCTKALLKVGYRPIKNASWKSVFYHDALRLLLVVYVDDFKLSGPKENLAEGWRLIREDGGIKMDPATGVGRYLGCDHSTITVEVEGDFNPRHAWMQGLDIEKIKQPPSLELKRQSEVAKQNMQLNRGDSKHQKAEGASSPNTKKNKITFMKYDMKGFLEQCVARYMELCFAKYSKPLKHAETPFLDESRPEHDENPIDLSECRDIIEEVDESLRAAAAAPKAKGKAKATKPTPPLDGNPGVLGDSASAILMKILYAARMGRYDLVRPVARLATRVTKWTELCDQKLHRLVCYIKSSLDVHMYAWVGDEMSDVEIVLYCDADLSGDRTDGKSTSGVFLCLMGPNTFVPLCGLSKKQTSVATSTPEAEIVAVHHGVCKEGLPALDLWETILRRNDLVVRVMEDNSACTRVIISGSNPSMRHISRTQRIDITWLNERFARGNFGFIECPSAYQAGDIFTKHCCDSAYWNRNLMLIGHFRKGQIIKAGATNACPANKVENPNEDLEILKLAVISDNGRLRPPDRDHITRVTYDLGETKNVEGECCAVANKSDEDERCAVRRLIGKIKNARIPLMFKDLIVEPTGVRPDRAIIEFCCGPNSVIGQRTSASKGCRVYRITEGIDANSEEGFFLAAKGCTFNKALLFSSIPCTGGSSWSHINKHHHTAWKKVRSARKIYRKIWETFEKVCKIANECGTLIALEWPTGCIYWKQRDVMKLINDYGLRRVNFHGCALGVKSILPQTKGMPIKKPWTIFTNCDEIVKGFEGKLCSKDHEHAECRGKDAKHTETYSSEFASILHRAFDRACR